MDVVRKYGRFKTTFILKLFLFDSNLPFPYQISRQTIFKIKNLNTGFLVDFLDGYGIMIKIDFLLRMVL